jgi:hypothetical protein
MYRRTLRGVYQQELTHRDALAELIGAAAVADKMGRRQRALNAVEGGLIRRDLFVATPASNDRTRL